MKKGLILLISVFYISSLFSQEIQMYYDDKADYKSPNYHRFQLSTNTRLIYREIPIVFEFAFIKELSVGLSLGIMPSRDYTYYQFGEEKAGSSS